MQTFARKFFLFSLLLTSAMLFASCKAKSETSGDLSFYGNNTQNGQGSGGQVGLDGKIKGSQNGEVALNQQLSLRGTQNQQQTNQQQTQPPVEEKGLPMKTLADFEAIKATQATITTNKGDIEIALYGDKVPLTVTNFLNLVKAGYYDGIKFHRVIEDFMAQVGDPLTKDDSQQQLWGTGGPGYVIQDEFDPTLMHDSEGIVSMANAGPNTGGSQFFITYGATPWLNGKHAVFGKVTKGMDVLRQIQVGDSIVKISYQ